MAIKELRIKKIILILLTISVIISATLFFPGIFKEHNNALKEIQQAQKELFNSKTVYHIDINKYPQRLDDYYKTKKKYPKLFVDNNDFFKTQPHSDSDYAIYIEKQAIHYKKTLLFDEGSDKITTAYYDGNDKLAYIDIYYTDNNFEDSAFLYNSKGNLVNAAQGGGSNRKSPISALFNSNKQLLTYCYWKDCANNTKIPIIDTTTIMLIVFVTFTIFVGISILLSLLFILWLFILKSRNQKI